MNLFAGLGGKELGNGLSWINEPQEWTFGAGGLSVRAEERTDFFIDEEGPSVRRSAHFLSTNAVGDFELTARVSVDMHYPFDSGCLMLMDDESKWAKVCFENWMGRPSIVSVVTDGYSDDCPSYPVEAKAVYLKILRAGNCFGFHYSLDGAAWIIVRYFNLKAAPQIRVGVAAQAPVGESCQIVFSALTLDQRKVASARNVA